MDRIVVLNENRMECERVRSILSGGLKSAEILMAKEGEAAIKLLQEGNIDLLIADISKFDPRRYEMMAQARAAAPDTPILVTSIGLRPEIAPYVWRLGLQDYLLKPCRPSWLLAAVRALKRSVSLAQDDKEQQRREKYLRLLEEQMRAFCYKKCTNIAKDYLDSLYKDIHNKNMIQFQALRFAEELIQTGVSLGDAVQAKLARIMEQFRLRFDQQVNKYETYLVFKRILNVMFDVFDEDGSYQVSGSQRLLNYIDRNVESGISLDQAAEYANMSSYYFSRFFKKMTGVNFIAYVTDGKIEAAKEMLEDTDMPIISIACELSYSEANYFSKAFKQKVRMTPTEYRELHCGARGRLKA